MIAIKKCCAILQNKSITPEYKPILFNITIWIWYSISLAFWLRFLCPLILMGVRKTAVWKGQTLFHSICWFRRASEKRKETQILTIRFSNPMKIYNFCNRSVRIYWSILKKKKKQNFWTYTNKLSPENVRMYRYRNRIRKFDIIFWNIRSSLLFSLYRLYFKIIITRIYCIWLVDFYGFLTATLKSCSFA